METAGQTGAPPPAAGLNRPALELLNSALRAVEAKDLATILDLLDEDAVVIDPNYPTPRMAGRTAIADGMRWAFGAIAAFRFEPVHAFVSASGEHAALEVEAHHMLPGGRKLELSQVFVIDARDGRVARLQAYQPNGPGGLVGVVLGLTRVARRLGLAGRRRRA
jgi:ketosteroid isomerase-like protein